MKHNNPRQTDKFIQKTRKLYLDTRTQRNMTKLNEELSEVQTIMTKNIQEVLGQGEKLESEYENKIEFFSSFFAHTHTLSLPLPLPLLLLLLRSSRNQY